MISKKLLSEVWGSEVTSIENLCNMWDMEVLPFWVKQPNRVSGFSDKKYHIAIETIAYKCKEWAFSKGYTVETYKKIKQERPITFIKIYCNNSNRYIKEYELAKTETFEADIRACEWIVENVKWYRVKSY